MKKKNSGFLMLLLLAVAIGMIAYALIPGQASVRSTVGTNTLPVNDTPDTRTFETLSDIAGYQYSKSAGVRNLTVMLIYGDASIAGDRYLTLGPAMKSRQVRIIETSDVNRLSIQNKSDRYVYIHSGDIVRGGKQDRTIRQDVIVPPGAKNMDLSAFCVESGRWHERGNENRYEFSVSENLVASKGLKKAMKVENSQRNVWAEVKEYQDSVTEVIRTSKGMANYNAASQVSESSLELTLEDETLKSEKDSLIQVLRASIGDLKGAVGIACFINGEAVSVDLFNNHQLFQDMFSKLLEAAVAESLTVKEIARVDFDPGKALNFLLSEEVMKENIEEINRCTRVTVLKSVSGHLHFETTDKDAGKWVHRNILPEYKRNN